MPDFKADYEVQSGVVKLKLFLGQTHEPASIGVHDV